MEKLRIVYINCYFSMLLLAPDISLMDATLKNGRKKLSSSKRRLDFFSKKISPILKYTKAGPCHTHVLLQVRSVLHHQPTAAATETEGT